MNQPTTSSTYPENSWQGNDESLETAWNSGNGNPGNWWQVDLGQDYVLTEINTLWEYNSPVYRYYIEVSSDGESFERVIDQTQNETAGRERHDVFPAGTCARHVRITMTAATGGFWMLVFNAEIIALVAE